MKPLRIKIKFFTDAFGIDAMQTAKFGDWIDLRAAETVELKEGEYRLIRLGVGMLLPEGYEAHVAPRSSTFQKFGIIQANSMGVIDHDFCGETDEWLFPAIALRKTKIAAGERICQFRIVKSQPPVELVETEQLKRESRGGLGSTGYTG